MNENEIDQSIWDKILEGHQKTMAERDRRRERRERLNQTVINLSNPQLGMCIKFGDSQWRIMWRIDYEGDVDPLYNRGMLILQKLNGESLYSVPYRVNNNLEYRTLKMDKVDRFKTLIINGNTK